MLKTRIFSPCNILSFPFDCLSVCFRSKLRSSCWIAFHSINWNKFLRLCSLLITFGLHSIGFVCNYINKQFKNDSKMKVLVLFAERSFIGFRSNRNVGRSKKCLNTNSLDAVCSFNLIRALGPPSLVHHTQKLVLSHNKVATSGFWCLFVATIWVPPPDTHVDFSHFVSTLRFVSKVPNQLSFEENIIFDRNSFKACIAQPRSSFLFLCRSSRRALGANQSIDRSIRQSINQSMFGLLIFYFNSPFFIASAIHPNTYTRFYSDDRMTSIRADRAGVFFVVICLLISLLMFRFAVSFIERAIEIKT